jgi:glutathione S-transferase
MNHSNISTTLKSLPYEMRLITFPVSHYCEKARWALDRVMLEYCEERHSPLFHFFYTKRHGSGSVPILIADDRVLTDSEDILKYLDNFLPEARKLYPSNLSSNKQLQSLEALLNIKFGEAVRIWTYFYTLNNSSTAISRFTAGVPTLEKLLFPKVYPLIRFIINRKLKITTESFKNSLNVMTEIFDSIGELISDGRKYIFGEHFTAVDLTFAALSTPIVRPPQYGDPALNLSNLKLLPLAMAKEVEIFRAMPAGQYSLKLWHDRKHFNNTSQLTA